MNRFILISESVIAKQVKLFCWLWLLILFLIPLKKINAQTLDQNQPVYNGGTSERNLPGYYEWQSFTAGLNGPLSKIDLMFCNTNVKVNGIGTLKVYTGQGTTGTLLLTQAVNVNGTAYNFNQPFWQSWNLLTTPTVAVGSLYTFQFIPIQGGGLTDPYLIQINIPSAYPSGQNYNLGTLGDCAFRTYVNTSPLPVELVFFRGENINKINHLYWSTASEINNDYFNVEKSSDGIDFESIETIKGHGNSNQLLNYFFNDVFPFSGINYYRLKQVDYNGEFQHSDIIAVTNKSTETECNIYSEGNGNFTFRCNEIQKGVLLIYDMHGKLIAEKQINASSQEIKINLNNNADGIYSLYFINEGENKGFKIFKN